MATRFYFRENSVAPITPAVHTFWNNFASPFARHSMFTTTDGTDTLATTTGFTSTTPEFRCHRQFISNQLSAGFTFDQTVTFQCQVQCLESAANDNAKACAGVRILSSDGTIVRVVAHAPSGWGLNTEANTALRNLTFMARSTPPDYSYTTVDGDRLVVELGHFDVSGTSISVSSRWGSAGSTDLGENETSTSTTERPWIETSLNLTFYVPSVPYINSMPPLIAQ